MNENDEGDEEDSTAEGQDNEGQDEKSIKALRRMGIKAPNHFDSKRDRNFETWLKQTEFHLKVIKWPEEDTTNALILLDRDSFEAAQYLKIEAKTKYFVAKQKLKEFFAITETKEELIDKLDWKRQEHGEYIESVARDIKLILTEIIQKLPIINA